MLVHLAMLVQSAISAGTFLAAKRAVGELSPFEVALFRFALAGLFYAALWRWSGVRIPRRDLLALAGLGVLAIPVNQGLFLYGMTLTTPGHGALLYALAPVFVFLLARWRLGERTTRLEVAGVALALAGVVVVLAGRGAVAAAADAGRGLRGDLLILVAVLAWSFYGVAAKPYAERYGALASAGAALTFGCAAYLPVGLALSSPASFAHASAGGWATLVYLALLSSVAGYVLYVWALRHTAAGRVAIWSNTQPVLTAALSWALLGERVTAGFAVGGAMVIAGVVMTERG